MEEREEMTTEKEGSIYLGLFFAFMLVLLILAFKAGEWHKGSTEYMKTCERVMKK